MIPNSVLGAIFALSSALVYGSADFFGGIATRRNNTYAVLSLSSVIGIIPMTLLGLLIRENIPNPTTIIWSCVAGAAGTFGLALLYYGLANGSPIIVSPISGIIGASLPVIFALLTDKFPTTIQISGFLIAIPTIYLLSQTLSTKNKDESSPVFNHINNVSSISIGISAGIFFGFFFIALAQITKNSFFYPLAISKLVSFVLSLSFSLISHHDLPNLLKNPAVILAGILDPSANGLYLLSLQFTRIDIAAVLASLYPTGTILMSVIFQKEAVSKRQWFGFGLCIVSIVLIMS